MPVVLQDFLRGPLAYALAWGLLGLALNLVAVPLAGGMDFVLGNFAYLVVASRLRAPYALLCALVTAAPYVWHWGHPWGLVTFGAEALVVAWLRGRHLPVFYGDVLYWLLVGMPLTAGLIVIQGSLEDAHLLAVCAKQAFNGVVYGAFAGILVTVTEPWLRHPWPQQPALLTTLRARLVHAMILVATFTLAGAALLIATELIRYQETLLHKSLDETARFLRQRTVDHIDTHRRGIAMLAELLGRSAGHDALVQPMLLRAHGLYGGFVTMLAAAPDGRIVAASPVTGLETVARGVFTTVADREYFRAAIDSPEVFVSDVFRGRGFGSEPIVAISAAYRDASGVPLGVVEGSLDVGAIPGISRPAIGGEPVRMILTDRGGKVIHASDELGFESLENLEDYRVTRPAAGRDTATYRTRAGEVEFLVRRSVLPNGWTVHAMMGYASVIDVLNRQYLGIFLMLALAAALAALLAERLARRISQPLERMARELSAPLSASHAALSPIEAGAPVEIALVHGELERSLRTVEQQRDDLEAQVRERTRDLERANELLQALASADALTGLSNRRVMEERFPLLRAAARRAGTRVGLAVLDLDHFKVLNDTHGHLVGDQCLIRIGVLMQQEFGRDMDIAARFGGEEFVIAVEVTDEAAFRAKLERLRERIAMLELASESGYTVRVTASLGALVANADFSGQLADWVRVADNALYRAKASGRNAVVVDRVDGPAGGGAAGRG